MASSLDTLRDKPLYLRRSLDIGTFKGAIWKIKSAVQSETCGLPLWTQSASGPQKI